MRKTEKSNKSFRLSCYGVIVYASAFLGAEIPNELPSRLGSGGRSPLAYRDEETNCKYRYLEHYMQTTVTQLDFELDSLLLQPRPCIHAIHISLLVSWNLRFFVVSIVLILQVALYRGSEYPQGERR